MNEEFNLISSIVKFLEHPVFISLVSGLFAVGISMYYTKKLTIEMHLKEIEEYQRRYKLRIFSQLMANRGDITQQKYNSRLFQEALNQVFIAYNGCTDVINTFERFRKLVMSENRDQKKIEVALLNLLKSMAKELDISYKFTNNDLFLRTILIVGEDDSDKMNVLTKQGNIYVIYNNRGNKNS